MLRVVALVVMPSASACSERAVWHTVDARGLAAQWD